MAEDHQEKDEKKPKATLIKHRKEESAASTSDSDDQKKRKTKIVVKRKSGQRGRPEDAATKSAKATGKSGEQDREPGAAEAKPESAKPESAKPAAEAESSAPSAGQAETTPTEVKAAESTQPAAKGSAEPSPDRGAGQAAGEDSGAPASGKSGQSVETAPAAAPDTPKSGEPEKQPADAPSDSTDTAAKKSGTGAGEAAASSGADAAAGAAPESGEEAAKSPGGDAGSTTGGESSEPKPRRTFRRQPSRPAPAPYRRAGSTGRHVSTSELESRAEKAESRPAPTQGRGPGGPGGGGDRRPGGGGGGQRPFPPRSGGGPPRGGGGPPRSGGGPPPPGAPTQQKGSGSRKFFKSKKKESGGRGARDRRDRQSQEKEIYYSKKRAQQKTNPVPKEIEIMEVVSVSELARKMNLKASDIIGKLMSMGMMVTINQQIDSETAEIVANEYGSTVKVVSLYDETVIDTPDDKESDLTGRPAIVTVMGHVDHGKTKLLDAIRSKDVAGDEFGGITQHIGAYQVETDHGKLTFLDTPGHEAFTLMRARGANVTDIVILVVAADDGVMPQTREAIDHAKDAKVPIIVAVNKVDLHNANVDRVKQQLSELDLIPEDWGGNTLFCEVSALKNEGVKELLESVALQAEVLELQASHDRAAEGKVIETRIDPGRGTVSSVLIQRGTLKVGDAFVAGVFPGRVRAMFNDRGERVEVATPSMPVEILGLTGIPEAGDPFQVTESDKHARQVGDKRQELRKLEDAKNVKKITLDNLYDTIQEGNIQDLKVVVKGDVHGSVEAVKNALEGLSTDEIHLSAIRAAAGAINENDIMLASASNAIVVGFHVRPTPRAAELAEREKVEIRKYGIIYDAVDDMRTAMEGMLTPELREETVASVEVREVFKVPKIGVVAGCFVKTGTVKRNAKVHVIRESVEIFTGKIDSLRRFKDDVREVQSGYECGIGIEKFDDLKVGDELEIFEVREIAKKLGESRASKEKASREQASKETKKKSES